MSEPPDPLLEGFNSGPSKEEMIFRAAEALSRAIKDAWRTRSQNAMQKAKTAADKFDKLMNEHRNPPKEKQRPLF